MDSRTLKLIVERRAVGNAVIDAALHPVLRRAYAARGVRDSSELALTLDRLVPVGTLDCIDAAVRLILEHRGRRILVIGDFDADGATSTALIVRCLRGWGFASVDFLVPNRFEFGYGLTPEIVGLAAERAPSLIITVDNGISSLAGVAAARERGIQVLITDHHLPGAALPAADVIVNPNVPGSRFASRALAGVGVAFYVMAALRRELEARGEVASPAAHGFTRPGGAGHGGRSRAARCQQPCAGGAGHPAHSRGPRGAGHSCAAGDCRPRAGGPDRRRPRICDRSAPQRGGQARRHVDRHSLPAQ